MGSIVVVLVLFSAAQPFWAVVAQQNQNATANFVKVNAPVIALTHVRIIDGTVQAGRRLRSGQAHRIGQGTGGNLVAADYCPAVVAFACCGRSSSF
jgi:hypothetical protein